MTEYVHVGRHAETLASSRGIGPGERIADKDLDEADRWLIDDGVLVDVDSFGSGPSNTPVAQELPTAADLKARAADLNIEGRSKMTADELRQAIADAESEETANAS